MREKWFVYSVDENFELFDTEEAARERFEQYYNEYCDDARGETEWNVDVEQLAWGKIYASVELVELKLSDETKKEMIRDGMMEEDEDGVYFDAFIVNHLD
jgi:hypothetical protein